MKRKARLPWGAAWFLLATLLAGCAGLSPATGTRETVRERATQYMQAQIGGQWDRVYSYFDSSTRAKVTREDYVKRTRNLPYTGFQIEDITILPSGEQATVKVKIDLRFMGRDFKGAPQSQEWVREQGEWFVKVDLLSRKIPFSSPAKGK